ncbi:HlyD family secretion protein [Anthocerotibacter panamensis]|uniref:HlyD family secretion protein n=1 Tax=Anthocerotibacter panamensis TaxID=2857077 RepID=UPI001C4021B9|nr:HlyD family secretion protein [Anthocerotibacter panamensis]
MPATQEQELVQEPSIPVTPAPVSKRKPNLWVLGLVGGGLLTASVVGYHWWSYATSHEDTDNATLAGYIHPVSSRINGTVQQVLVEDNQTVKAGEILVMLDPRDFQSRVQQAQAALEVARRQASVAQASVALARERATAQDTQAQGGLTAAEAAIASAQAVVAQAKTGIPTARAQLVQAQANLRKANLDFQRFQKLVKEGAISRQQFDSLQTDYTVAQAARDSAAEGVRQATAKLTQAQEGVASAQALLTQSRGGLQDAKAAQVQVTVNQNQYAQAQAAVTQAEVALEDAKLQLSYTRITAPTAGRVGRRTAEVGQRIQPGQPLLSIVEEQTWVTANFKETQLERMRPRQPVEVKLDAFPNHSFTGRVDSIAPASGSQFSLLPPDNATGNFTKIVQRIPVKIVLDPQGVKGFEQVLAPGMSAVVSVNVAAK